MMSNIAERIPLFVSPAGTENPAGASILWRAVTHRGLVRLHNEDAFCAETKESRHFFAVTDGLGGHRGGAIASETAIETVKTEFMKWNGKGPDKLVIRAVQKANQEVFSMTQTHPELFSMQTTATVVAIDKGSMAVAHVGDCRLYRMRSGRVALLTKDHSVAADLLRLHLISQEDAAEHPGRHQLTRSVGSSPFLRVDLVKEDVLPGDSFILCSDGLWSEVSRDAIKDALTERDIAKTLEQLVGKVLKAGAPDNITAIVFRIAGGECGQAS